MRERELDKIVHFIREIYGVNNETIYLHEPRFNGNEKKYLLECIDSTFVSSVGKFVTQFENMLSDFTGTKYAIAAANGTSALHIALLLCNVRPEDEVITQALTFIATANAISYTGAKPIFVDVDLDTLGLSPNALKQFLVHNSFQKDGYCFNRLTGKRIKACVPMHTFGHPCRIDEIVAICKLHNIEVVEDAAESLGSYYKGRHTGTFGKVGIISFNGNKTITTGGGGMILTDDPELGTLAKHLTTTAKLPHKWEFVHDRIGYNYRLTNLAAALGCAQMEELPEILTNKRNLAISYMDFFKEIGIDFFKEPKNSISNYWLNTLILKNLTEKEELLEYLNKKNIMVRPVWKLMSRLEMYKNCICGTLIHTEWLSDRIINLPSSITIL